MLPYVMAWLSQFEKDEEGQGLVEYALIIVLVSIVAFAALQILGTTVSDVFDQINTALGG
jgi:pilus assembly protein Flp/PilA